MHEPNAPQRRILIVEDEGIVAADIQKCVEDAGFEVTAIAASADDAIREASKTCPDLVLMDIRIQGSLDGIETADLLRRRFAVPVIYLTAHGDKDTIERAKKTEPMAFLLKPFKQVELNNAIEIALYRARREKSLREWERWFVTAMGSVGDAVLSVDAQGHVSFLNAAAEMLTGWSWSEAFGRPIGEIVSMEDEQSGRALDPAILRTLDTRRAADLPSALLLSKGGARRPVSESALPVGDENAFLGAVMVLRDQSERRKLHQRLELGDRLASVGAMAAGVAHEINNPLTAVIGNIDFALGELQGLQANGFHLPSAASDRLERIGDALRDAKVTAGRMARIVADLKAFSRPAEEKPGTVDVQRVLGWAIDISAHELRHRASICRDFGEVPAVEADETRLGQVFVNLLVNAAQAIPPGAPDQKEVRVSTRTAPGGQAVIEVRDPGCGMDPKIMASIFEPFFTTKPMGQGSGLGLSICQGIVKSLGGDIEVESEIGKGSTFRVLLPPAARREETARAPFTNGASVRGARVLVIDNELMIRRIIERALRTTHEVASVSSANEAARLLAEGRQFDVILCDLAMPDMTGMEFCEHLSRHYPEALSRVVLLSGGVFTDAMAEFLKAAKNPYLSKPFNVTELRRVVADSLSPRQ